MAPTLILFSCSSMGSTYAGLSWSGSRWPNPLLLWPCYTHRHLITACASWYTSQSKNVVTLLAGVLPFLYFPVFPVFSFIQICLLFLAATKQLYEWYFLSVCLSVRPSVCPSHLPIIVSSWNFQELSPRTRVTSMQKVKVRGQRSRSQRSRPNLTVSGL